MAEQRILVMKPSYSAETLLPWDSVGHPSSSSPPTLENTSFFFFFFLRVDSGDRVTREKEVLSASCGQGVWAECSRRAQFGSTPLWRGATASQQTQPRAPALVSGIQSAVGFISTTGLRGEPPGMVPKLTGEKKAGDFC